MQMTLPERIVMPPETVLNDEFHRYYWKYVRGTVESLAGQVDLSYSTELGHPAWSAFEVRVNDQIIAIDFSDFHLVANESSNYRHWLRFHHTPAMQPFSNLGSFPPWSFLDWDQYTRFRKSERYTARGEQIIYRHSSLSQRASHIVERRQKAGDLLQRNFPNRLVADFVPQDEFFQTCLESLVVVHIPGSHPHILDRTVQQMFALGVCVISPDLWTTCLERRPQAQEHYLMLRDDYEDLPETINWVLKHRKECAEIGQRAQAFFDRHCTPPAIWGYVQRRVSSAERSPASGTSAICRG
jgi:hypothetical protein